MTWRKGIAHIHQLRKKRKKESSHYLEGSRKLYADLQLYREIYALEKKEENLYSELHATQLDKLLLYTRCIEIYGIGQ